MPLCANTHSKTVTSCRSNFVSRLMMPFADRSPSLYHPPKTHTTRGTSNGRAWNKFRCWIRLGLWFRRMTCVLHLWAVSEFHRKGREWPRIISNKTSTDVRTRIWKHYITPKYIRIHADLSIKHLVLILFAFKSQSFVTYRPQFYRFTLFVSQIKFSPSTLILQFQYDVLNAKFGTGSIANISVEGKYRLLEKSSACHIPRISITSYKSPPIHSILIEFQSL
jgi:hypothetical protein